MMFYQRLSILISAFLVAAFLIQPGGAQISPDAAASFLLALKIDIVDNLGFLADWREAEAMSGSGGDKITAPCNWTGVSCDDEFHQVVSLDLSSMNLTGKINANIGSLTSLAALNLSDNLLSGNLPPEIGNLFNLNSLDISENQFTGRLPGASIAKLQLLTFFSAHDNNFTGPMPDELAEIAGLEVLDLAGSYFSGEIPRRYANLTRIKTLKLSGNLLAGSIPRELGFLAELRHLELGYNNLSGGIPNEIGHLVQLEYLDLSCAGLSGSIPAQIGNLKQLHTVFLYKNKLSGPLPQEIGNMSGLMSLDISDNQLSGAIPATIGRLPRLSLLHLMMNNLNGSLPDALGDSENLETLSVWNNFITGSLPARLGRSVSLSWIDVSSNLISGEIPRGICSGGSLIKLELFSNAFTGTIPDMSSCRKLLRARFHDNLLTGSIPAAFGTSMANLTRLELSKNRLNGSIPDEISKSPRLAFLDISANRLAGGIPRSIWTIPQLQELHAAGNLLSGDLGPEIANATRISVLDLSENKLVGAIPSEISSCGKLVSLNLRSNGFSGTIPPALASLPVLAVLDLSSNSLEGRIPAQFAQSRSLEDFNVSYNRLSGELPHSGIFESATPSVFFGNPGLCGGVLAACSSDSSKGASNSAANASRRTGQWLMGVFFVLSFIILLVALRFLHKRYGWRIFFGIRHSVRDSESAGGTGAASSDWPWKMTAFQRLGFTVEELLECINEKNIIGKGAMGVVYRAEMASGEIVALKQLCNNRESYYTDQGFMSEVKVLGGIRHRNIVRLLGYCSNHHTDMLLYEYMPNGSLSDLLHKNSNMIMSTKPSSSIVLTDWVARYKIAMGVAQGIAYLHHDCFPHVIIHRDVKSSNILLDHNMEARVADFGLAKLIEARESMSVVAGSYGYIAPEYAYTMKVREKGDIYSYGVVLLELLTGKRPIEPEFGEGRNIVDWVHSKLRKGRLVDVLDPSIGGCETVQEEMLLVLRISMLCTSTSPRDRPSMRDVVSMLLEAKPRRKQIKCFPRTQHRSGSGEQDKEQEDEDEEEEEQLLEQQ